MQVRSVLPAPRAPAGRVPLPSPQEAAVSPSPARSAASGQRYRGPSHPGKPRCQIHTERAAEMSGGTRTQQTQPGSEDIPAVPALAPWPCRAPFPHFSPGFPLPWLFAGGKNLTPRTQGLKSSLFDQCQVFQVIIVIIINNTSFPAGIISTAAITKVVQPLGEGRELSTTGHL